MRQETILRKEENNTKPYMEKSEYIILVDMDDTMEDLLTSWVECLNRKYNLQVNPKEVTSWEIPPYFPSLTPFQVYEALVTEELWKTVKPIDGAVEYLKRLVEEGFTVRVCTASSPTSYALKMKWVMKRYFPFLDTRTQCICIHDKHLLKANVLLDDNYKNLLNSSYQGILFTRKHNKNLDYPIRVNSWEEFYKYVKEDFSKKL